MTAELQPLDILRNARRMILNRDDWTVGSVFEYIEREDKTCMCALGAIYAAAAGARSNAGSLSEKYEMASAFAYSGTTPAHRGAIIALALAIDPDDDLDNPSDAIYKKNDCHELTDDIRKDKVEPGEIGYLSIDLDKAHQRILGYFNKAIHQEEMKNA